MSSLTIEDPTFARRSDLDALRACRHAAGDRPARLHVVRPVVLGRHGSSDESRFRDRLLRHPRLPDAALLRDERFLQCDAAAPARPLVAGQAPVLPGVPPLAAGDGYHRPGHDVDQLRRDVVRRREARQCPVVPVQGRTSGRPRTQETSAPSSGAWRVGLRSTARDGEFDSTPLLRAAGAGRVEAVELLIRRGADLNSVDRARTTPLHLGGLPGPREGGPRARSERRGRQRGEPSRRDAAGARDHRREDDPFHRVAARDRAR